MKNFSEIYGARQLELAQSDFSPQDKEAISLFLNNLQARGVSPRRLAKYCGHFAQLAKMLPKSRPLCLLTGSEIDVLLNAVNSRANWSGWTRHDYQLALKKFFAFTDGNAERAGRIRIITPLPELVDESTALTLQDVEKMLAACRNLRDKTIIRLLFETGCRMSEFLGLRVGSVEDHGEYLRFKVEGTKNRYARRAVLVDDQAAIALFREYLAAHPQAGNALAALWVEPVRGQPLEERNLNNLLQYRARTAQISKAVNPHSFRKGSVTHFRRRGLTNASLETRFGWRKGTDMLAIYDRSGEQALLEDLRRTMPRSEEEEEEIASQQIEQAIYRRPALWQGVLNAIKEDKIAPALWRKLAARKKGVTENDITPRAGLEPAAA